MTAESVLVVSSKHLGEALVLPYGNGRIDDIASMAGPYGWLVWTGSDLIRMSITPNEPVAFQVLRDILQYAQRRGCPYVMFDADGEELEGFPTYDW